MKNTTPIAASLAIAGWLECASRERARFLDRSEPHVIRAQRPRDQWFYGLAIGQLESYTWRSMGGCPASQQPDHVLTRESV